MAIKRRPSGRDATAKAAKKKAQQFAAVEPSNLKVKLFAAAKTLSVLLALLQQLCEVIEQYRSLLF